MSAGTRTLVTGATGYIGGRLAATLAADGQQVSALVRGSSDPSALPDGVTAIVMPERARDLAPLLADVAPEVVYHLATCFRGGHTTDDIEPLVTANVLFGTQLAEALSAAPPRVFVNTGTVWQRDEAGGYQPAALYAATKQAMEDILRFYAGSGALRVADVKLFDTYGPGDPRGKLLALLASAADSGTALLMSPGEQLIDLLHVDDVVAALRAAADAASEPWSSWSASSGDAHTLRDLVALFERATGRTVPVEWGARPYRPREMFTPWDAGDPVPGWRPRVPLAEGIAQVWGAA